jgi:hypothetical protein
MQYAQYAMEDGWGARASVFQNSIGIGTFHEVQFVPNGSLA